ncbi:MAG: prepilin-type cleavage/methylation domain-containing protein [Hydrogenophilales bacterium CG_4_9_14_3_um_filter_59_35]|nr:MAG: prepilin-type cleavage/methylation domain-containing protein [Hydrogenophilales bacterium CG18_big_fil_WC_8_21_14_2_50_58_12]PJB04823.1 MAG: prepilin-type cleavage/methylation domain-containing protein [Hydrogenophilales bacterium CG_4_9_14_3_um_filter_59_35]
MKTYRFKPDHPSGEPGRVGRQGFRLPTRSGIRVGTKSCPPYLAERGFTLVEMAIVLVIVVLLLGGLLMPLSTQVEQRRIGETQKALEEIKEALIGFAANQTPPHLPCPDKTSGGGAGTANDGLEDVTAATGACVTQEGNIPWATLGVADVDAWGNRIHYSVTAIFSNRSPATMFALASAGTLRVCTAPTCTTQTATALPAIVLSYGKNGFGAINQTGGINPAPTSADEQANTDLNVDFVSHTPTQAGAANGEFDDLVTWLSPNILFNRMVAAGKLP